METSTLACRPFNLHLTPGLTVRSENKRGSFRRNPSWPESTSFLERSKSLWSFQAQIFTSCLSVSVKELKISPAYDPNSKGTSCRPSWSQIIHTRCPLQKTVLQESSLLHQAKVVQWKPFTEKLLHQKPLPLTLKMILEKKTCNTSELLPQKPFAAKNFVCIKDLPGTFSFHSSMGKISRTWRRDHDRYITGTWQHHDPGMANMRGARCLVHERP